MNQDFEQDLRHSILTMALQIELHNNAESNQDTRSCGARGKELDPARVVETAKILYDWVK